MRHPAAIVLEQDLHVVVASLLNLDVDTAGIAVREGVRDRVEEQVGQHLAVGTGKAVHGQVRLAVDRQRQVLLAHPRLQTHHHLLGQVGEIERPLVGVVAVGRDLLERLHQFGRPVEVGDELRRRIATGLEEIVEDRSPQIAALDLGGELRGLALQRRCHREADADRVVDLVRDAGDQTSQGRELLGLDERVLGLS